MELAITPCCSLTITDCPAGWLPQGKQYGQATGTPGNSVDFTATITIGAPRKIKFFLFDVSTEPGVCINYGDETGDSPDLKFIQTASVNPSSIFDPPSPDGLRITTKNPVTSATVTVTCYDWGAWGKIRACCFDESGSDCQSYTPAKNIPVDELPAGGNHIADAWEPTFANNPATWDKDNTPSGTKRDGDGYSLYEEYRGVMHGFVGSHTRLKPRWKELFLYDQDLLHLNGHAAHKFIFLAGFMIQYVNKDPAKMMNGIGLAADDHRLINHKSEFAKLSKQFALHVRDFTLSGMGDWGLTDGAVLGPPKSADPLVKIDKAQVGTDLRNAVLGQGGNPGPGGAELAAYTDINNREVMVTTTHEMGHGCNVLEPSVHHLTANGGRPSPYGDNYSGEIMCVMRYDYDLVDAKDGTHPNMYGYRTAVKSPPGTLPARFEFSNYTNKTLSDLTPVLNIFCTANNKCKKSLDVKDD
jgi:hypothetical protein